MLDSLSRSSWLALVALGATAAACAQPPAGLPSDGGLPGDAAGDGAVDAPPGADAADASTGDARAGDASPDAAPPDAAPDAAPAPVTLVDPDGAGSGATLFTAGAADPSGPFFTALGTNQRSCGTCHDRTTGWTVAPAALQARFDASNGTDPIFRPVDGTTSPTADVSTVAARRIAYAVLLDKGLIRIGLPIPGGAEFTLVAVDDPYGFASASELSLFRRPLPATNLSLNASIMWDGREPSLAHQATDATLGHGQAASADATTMTAIVAFESALFTAQSADSVAGDLAAAGATGGPAGVATLPFHVGINDPFGGDPQHGTFDPDVFTLFTAWAALTGTDAVTLRRLSIARGEALFNTRTFALQGVPGIADQAAATCSTCHDTPGTGGHSLDEMMSLDLDSSGHRTADLPLYTLQRTSDGTLQQTSDPGRALITGKWADIGKFKIANLRGLAMRPPYFHNGVASSLASVVDFYNNKFGIGLTAQDEADLAAFLAAL